MKSSRLILYLLSIFLIIISFSCVKKEEIKTDAPQLKEIPWDLTVLNQNPQFEWINHNDSICSLLFKGEDYKGKPTKVFAYYASPETYSGEHTSKKYPAVVLMHGGGGTAYTWWVDSWVKRGYAVIALDFAGNRPVLEDGKIVKKKLLEGGPDLNDTTSFYNIDSLITDQWQFHAVSAIIRAHSLIRSFDEVDATNTALTGISWGGYLTCIVSGIDNRFNATVPVYGSGFLKEAGFWKTKGVFDSMTAKQVEKWHKLWDPSAYISYAEMPVLFINGTNDRYYHLENFIKTAKLAKSKNIKIGLEMRHGHFIGAKIPEIFTFIDHYLRGTEGLPFITISDTSETGAFACFQTENEILSARLIYTTDTTDNESRKWLSVEAEISNDSILSSLPENQKAWYFEISDSRDLSVTSTVNFLNHHYE